MKKKNIRWNTLQILAMGFIGVILTGGVLLWLPFSNTEPIAFMDALFTSTSAVCVTGLVTIVPATQFTLTGKIILLLLIQIGGLGVIACGTAFILILRMRITVKERILIQETYNMDAPGGMVAMIIRVIRGTLIVEGIGALFYSFQFVPEFGLIKGIWFSVFHAISAFCNAGIDIIGDSSFASYVTNPIINLTTVVLIVVAGIGFSVWHDLAVNMERIIKNDVPKSWWFKRLTLHSKLAIVTTAILIIAGTLNFFIVEFNNPETMGGLTVAEKLMASLFHSVSTRTAGFATISQTGFTNESKFFTCILMFIGGSPGGTAGGVKSTTVAMLFLTAFSIFRSGHATECFGRRIADSTIMMGHAVIMSAILMLTTGTMLVTVFEPDIPFLDVLYETTSAMGTVGLSAGLTAGLSRASQVVIMALMYVGRIGPISLALLFGGMSKKRDNIRELPEQTIMVG